MSGLQGRKKRRSYLVMALSEVTLVAAGLACSTAVNPFVGDADGSGGGFGSGGSGGSGGINGTGGETLLASGGALLTSSGGYGNSSNDCAIAAGSSLEPPCSAADIVITDQCIFGSTVTVMVPLDGLSVPTAKQLGLFLVPGDFAEGQGGEGGQAGSLEPYPLSVALFPGNWGTSGPDGFEVTGPGEHLQTDLPLFDPEFAGYFVDYSIADRYASDFGVALLAVMDGDQVLLKRRVIFTQTFRCLIR